VIGGSAAVDVVVIGDGPAGSALALACRRADIDVLLVGDDAPWPATYSTWVDELPLRSDGGLVDVEGLLATRSDEVWAHGASSHLLRRTYATFDNERLRATLREDVTHRRERVADIAVAAVGTSPGHGVELTGGDRVSARVVLDATGWPPQFARRHDRRLQPAWQTALGVVLAEPPPGDLGHPTFMDFREVRSGDVRPASFGPSGVTTFCYSLPMVDGWLVEETVLAARPSVEPLALLPRLAARLGRHPDTLLAEAVRTEYVRIPLGGPLPDRGSPVVAFGAAAGYVHAATGYSVAASIRAAPRVAAAVASVLADGSGAVDSRPVAEAVWPRSLRRTRVLHDYGLEMLLDLDDDDVRSFFDAFFVLDPDDWASYLRVDTPPAQVSAVMARLFRASSWSTRRRLAGRNPLPLAQVLRR
jgi:lycopene beta-cyclase